MSLKGEMMAALRKAPKLMRLGFTEEQLEAVCELMDIQHRMDSEGHRQAMSVARKRAAQSRTLAPFSIAAISNQRPGSACAKAWISVSGFGS